MWTPYLIVVLGFVGGAIYVGGNNSDRIADIERVNSELIDVTEELEQVAAELAQERLLRQAAFCINTVNLQDGNRVMWNWLFGKFPGAEIVGEGILVLNEEVPALKCNEDNVPVRVDTGEPVGD
jgi:hypothetical protein